MLNHLVCGNFQHHEEDHDLPCSSPKSKSKRKDNNRDNNPYASRGLDKFSTLLSELDQRRKKVYSQMNPHDISFVRFTYSSNDDFVPIVVKVKNNNQKKHKSEEQNKVIRHLKSFSEPMDQKHVEETKQHKLELSHDDDDDVVVKKTSNKIESSGFSLNMLKKPSFYVPAVMILILLLLTVFGRSFATLCTCIVWYIVPILKDSVTAEGLHSPRGDSKASDIDKRSGKHSHQKSW